MKDKTQERSTATACTPDQLKRCPLARMPSERRSGFLLVLLPVFEDGLVEIVIRSSSFRSSGTEATRETFNNRSHMDRELELVIGDVGVFDGEANGAGEIQGVGLGRPVEDVAPHGAQRMSWRMVNQRRPRRGAEVGGRGRLVVCLQPCGVAGHGAHDLLDDLGEGGPDGALALLAPRARFAAVAARPVVVAAEVVRRPPVVDQPSGAFGAVGDVQQEDRYLGHGELQAAQVDPGWWLILLHTISHDGTGFRSSRAGLLAKPLHAVVYVELLVRPMGWQSLCLALRSVKARGSAQVGGPGRRQTEQQSMGIGGCGWNKLGLPGSRRTLRTGHGRIAEDAVSMHGSQRLDW